MTEAQQQARELWALGDYPAVATRHIAEVGRLAAEAAEVGNGDEVLDVACGAGNATIPAALTGAAVTGLDITPKMLEAAGRAAADAGVEIELIEGDAQELPFEDESFDVVLSVFGCMFAPDQQKTAREIARVLRPGGRMAVCAWTPEGNIGKMFVTIAMRMPPPPEGFQPPILWGSEDHVRGLFEGTGVDLDVDRAMVAFTAPSLEEEFTEDERDLPPIVNAKRVLEPEGKWEEAREALLERHKEANLAEDGSYRSENDYLVIKGRRTA
ncbi:MAG TPA: class I SAM-dependent methyltransferase [Solirubrobacterales bacterium]|nr:class I SAM-dependent methyltransferase [Solirubrobacterales bacterium]